MSPVIMIGEIFVSPCLITICHWRDPDINIVS